ncbi:YmfQ family protein [Undibacterium sp. SXout20W]|uniref:YmfQ family protein n=1 Tax=Undibacterium sp. SXout20W TaxID=3413051 RepID=UPI003BF0BA23
MNSTFSAADYLSALQSLLPRGRVWPRDPASIQTQVLSGLTPVYARQNLRSNQLLADVLPSTTLELLPEWEMTLGLPDPCAGVAPTIQARQAQVLARFTGVGGQSVAYMKAFATNLGYNVTITQFAPARAGGLAAGLPVCGDAFAHAWQVSAHVFSLFSFLAGSSCAGDPLGMFDNKVLECELREIAPAHTTVFFTYY